jgi:hypothetical protein
VSAGGNIVVESGGTYKFVGSSGTNEGTITVGNGATVILDGGASITGSGYTVVENGGTALIDLGNSTIVPQIAYGPVDVSGTSVNPIIMLDDLSAKLSINEDGYVLEGDATVYGIPGSAFFQIGESDSRKLTIDGVLTMATGTAPHDASLRIVVASGEPGIVGTPGAKIVLGGSDQIWLIDNSNNLNVTDCNFYVAGGASKVTNGKLSNNTYEWKEVGNGVYGWVAQN